MVNLGLTTLALTIATLALCASVPVAAQDDEMPTLIPQLNWENQPAGDRVFTNLLISIPEMDDFKCKIWCYEMGLAGVGTGAVGEDGVVTLTHDFNGATATTRFVPEPGSVLFEVTVTGPDPDKVRAVGSVNACWQLHDSEGFGNRGEFFDDFVSRCFIYTVRGLTLMGDTTRFPDTRAEKYVTNPERNNPPWVQVYLPIWHLAPPHWPAHRLLG